MAEPILTVEHLIKAYGETPVLDDISFAVKPGEVIVVVGPSGCGKSTLLRCLNGLEPTQSGRVRLGNETVAYGGKNLTQLRQRIGMVFQSYELFPHLTVLDNILLAPTKVQKRPKDEVQKEAEALLDRVGLLAKKNSYPRELSGGQIQLFKENIPIFERYNIERQIAQTFQRRVPLPSGGEIVIDETEALVAIDVNTGSHKGKDADGKDFILQANLEAVTEAARQVRLRNLGGLVIIDTIDMKSRKDRQAVYKRLKDEMEKDKAKSQVLPISQLGIIQMTRQRHAQSNSSGIYVACPYCGGKGIVKSARTMSGEIQRKIVATCRNLRESAGAQKEIGLLIMLHPENLQRLQNEDYEYLLNLEKQYNVKLTFRADPSYHVENFRVVPSEK